MKSYIEFNTKQRKLALSKFEQDLYKLMTNAVFGYSLLNHKNRIDFRLVTEKKKFVKIAHLHVSKGFK